MFSFKAVLIAAGLAVVSTSALALPTVPSQPAPGPIPQPSTGNGGLLLSIYDTDPSRPRSIVTYLGLNFQDILPSNMTDAAGGVLNFGSIDMSVFQGNLSTVRYTVFAADSNGQGGQALALSGPLNGTQLTFPEANGVAIVQGIASAADSFFAQIPFTCPGLNPCTTATGGVYAGAGTWGDKFGRGASAPINGSGAIGNAVGFYYLSADDSIDPDFVTANAAYANASGLGSWLLSAAGELTYSIAGEGGGSPVPVPAAIWLLLSGLTGFGVISRRKAAA